MRKTLCMVCMFWLCITYSTAITIYTIGDSTMANKQNPETNQERGWGMLFQSFFNAEEVKVENHAVNGRSSKSFLDENRWQPILDKLQPGDYVFIQFGHNDEKSENPKLYTDPDNTYWEYLSLYVNETREKGAYPVLLTPVVRRHFNEEGILVNSHGKYPDAVRELAAELEVPFIDMEKKSRRLIEGLGAEESKKLFMISTGKNDNTHFVEAGALAMGELVVQGIYENELPLSKYLIRQQNVVIRNGIPWFDDKGNIVNAHGACIVEDNGRYYLFGEYKSNELNAFYGFSCYSSDDLVNWKFERLSLPMQQDGILGPDRIGERVKVMKCPTTGEYIMFMHCDDTGYKDPYVGYASSPIINGEYTFHGKLLYNGEPIRRWDLGTFRDTDGKGYLLIHSGDIYQLSDDYKSAVKKFAKIEGAGESPAMLKKNGIYYLLTSHLTSWERNDNIYFTASSIEGPWTNRGCFAPEGTLTYNSQCSFVLPVVRGNDTIYMYMGDRWSFPHQSDAATYVWLPMQVDGVKLSIPEYWQAWDPYNVKAVDPLRKTKKITDSEISFNNPQDWKKEKGQIKSNIKGKSLEIPFSGTGITITGESNNQSGYAKVSILNDKQEEVYSSMVDFYSKVPDKAVRFKTPDLAKGNYTLIVEVSGIISEWFKKDGTRFGSLDSYVTLDGFYKNSDE